MQIVQELCKRPGLNKCGFDMPTIYIPNPNKVGQISDIKRVHIKWLLVLFIIFVPLCSAQSLCEPDWGGLSCRRENHQPDGPEHPQLPGEGLWAHQRGHHE